jgi:nicotinate-nucleotide adenylyltransferase
VKRIGIFGGTFNPIHYGHLIAAQTVGVELHLDKVYFVPCYKPPHKTERELASSNERLKMVQLALTKNPFFGVSDFEIKKGGKSYSIDTVRHFRSLYPGAKLFLIVGADTAQFLHKWKDVREITKIATFVAVNRPGYKPKPRHSIKHIAMEIPEMEISSSFIRHSRHIGRSIWYLTHERVVEYIYKKKLYTNLAKGKI